MRKSTDVIALLFAHAYVEGLWNLEEAKQKIRVLLVRYRHIDKKLLQYSKKNHGLHLNKEETKEYNTWIVDMLFNVAKWENDSEIEHLQSNVDKLLARYKQNRDARGLPVYDPPKFFINVSESEHRITTQKYFDVHREALVMSNPEVNVSYQEIIDIRKASTGRVYYESCSLTNPEYSVANELEGIKGGGRFVKSLENFVPECLAKIAGTDRAGIPLKGKDNELFSYFEDYPCGRVEAFADEDDEMEEEEKPSSDEDEVMRYSPSQGPANRGAASSRAPTYAPAHSSATASSSHNQGFGYAPAQNFNPPPQVQQQGPPQHANINNPYGRAQPYQPTPQPAQKSPEGVSTKWNTWRGNPPAGIDAFTWDKYFNRADSRGNNKADRQLARNSREYGGTRDMAIAQLISEGALPPNFHDINP